MGAIRLPIYSLAALPADTDTPKDVIAAAGASYNTRISGGCSGLRLIGQAASGAGKLYLYRYENFTPFGGPRGWFPYAEYHALDIDASKFVGKFSGRFAIEDTGPIDVIAVHDPALTFASVDDYCFCEGVKL